MTTEEVINWFCRVENRYMHSGDEPIIDYTLTVLRAQQERENPKPLTLDELREMDGESVWVVEPGAIPLSGHWFTCTGAEKTAFM